MELLANLWTEMARNASPEARWYLDHLREHPVTTGGLTLLAIVVFGIVAEALGAFGAWLLRPAISRIKRDRD
jgi:hypothetical protein